jgi:3-isopropylmalate/(R)-2-methylmalate dehydratase small subunit
MQAIRRVTSHLIPLLERDVDTDQIIPARFLKVTDKLGLGQHLFEDWRYLADGSPNPGFVFNQAQAQGGQILLAGANFGCGSSREHAAWALLGWGVKAVISTSFADIFRNNAVKNGLLTIEVDQETVSALRDLVSDSPQAEVTIDLESQSVSFGSGWAVQFTLDPFARHCLMEGVDQLGYLLSKQDAIRAYEAKLDAS